MNALLIVLAMQTILPGPPMMRIGYELSTFQDLGCKEYWVSSTVKLTWTAVDESQLIFLDTVFPHDSPQNWTLGHYEIRIFKNGKVIPHVSVNPPTTTYTYKISATATTGGTYCFKVYAMGYFDYLRKPRQETWQSEMIVQTLPVGWHTLEWPPILGIELNGYQVNATTDPEYINNYLLFAGETDELTSPSVTFFVAKPYTVYQKIWAVKLLAAGPMPKAPGRMTVTRK